MEGNIVQRSVRLFVISSLMLVLMLTGCNTDKPGSDAQAITGTENASIDQAGGAGSIPKYLYVADKDLNQISMFNVNSSTGKLTAMSTPTVATGLIPRSIVTNTVSGGTFAYVVNNGSNTIGVYKVSANPANPGLLVLKSTTSVGSSPRQITFIPGGTLKGKFAYVNHYGSYSIEIFPVNSSDGSLGHNIVETFPGEVADVAFSAQGANAYVAAGNDILVCTINSTTGSLVPQSTCTGDRPVYGFSVTPTNVYATGRIIRVWTRSGNTLTQKQTISLGEDVAPDRVVVEPLGGYLYTDMYGGGYLAGWKISSTDGTLSSQKNTGIKGVYPMGVTAEPSGKYVYATSCDIGFNDNVTVYSITRSTGALVKIQETALPTGSTPYAIAIAP